jgi:endonuclease/exonuclease/phosphatase family metal-dependent hydrolase
MASSIGVVTWNVHAGAGDVSGLAARIRAGEFSAGRPLDAVILLLQEAHRAGSDVPPMAPGTLRLPRVLPRPDPAHDIQAVAVATGLNVVYVPSMRNGPERQDRGNAVLSSLPVCEVTAIELPFEGQRRVALVARVAGRTSAGADLDLVVASVHFDTSPALLHGGPGAARMRQARAIIEQLEGASPVLVGGDFNTWWGDDEPAIKALRRAFPDAGAARGPTWRGPLATSSQLDYLFARTGGRQLTVRRLPERFGSDHHPLITILTTEVLTDIGSAHR